MLCRSFSPSPEPKDRFAPPQDLTVLVNRMPWQVIKASLAKRRVRQVKAGKKREDFDFLSRSELSACGSFYNACRPCMPIPWLVALLYLLDVNYPERSATTILAGKRG
jgi:hypothetical protein